MSYRLILRSKSSASIQCEEFTLNIINESGSKISKDLLPMNPYAVEL